MAVHAGPKIENDGLVLHLDVANTKSYPGTGTSWTDLSSFGAVGTLTGSPAYSTHNSGSLEFGPAKNYALVPAGGVPAMANLTVEIWYKMNATTGQDILFDMPFSIRLQVTNGGSGPGTFGTHLGNGGWLFTTDKGASPIEDDTWYHSVWTWDGANSNIYLNGELDGGPYAHAAGSSRTQTQAAIGFLNGTGLTHQVDGSIAVVKLYEKALTATEVRKNYNATRGRFETETYKIDTLTIAGGGGGSNGGGGAGGYIEKSTLVKVGVTYPIIVGAGGPGGTNRSTTGTNGSNSQGPGAIAIGGGAGARVYQYEDDATKTGNTGGSGGGSSGDGVSGGNSPGLVSKGIYGQGNRGGYGGESAGSDYNNTGGGGGGAGAVGGNGAGSATGGNGGDGKTSSITGSAVTRAGGGGGGLYEYFGEAGGVGGAGGGGNRGNVAGATEATSGTVNTGSGGGGGVDEYPGPGITPAGGAGGSGVVILRILTTDYSATTTGSPGVTIDGSYTILTYNSTGTYTA